MNTDAPKPDSGPNDTDRLQAGKRLLGNKVRFHHWAPGTGILCTAVESESGMVQLHGMTGWFASHLFEIDGDTVTVPVEGEVE